MGAPAFWELVLTVPAEGTEALANFLWECGALGVVEEEGGSGPRVRGFFAGGTDAAGIAARLATYVDALGHLGLPVPADVRLMPLADGRWAEAWREHFRPLAVGRHFLIAPPWAVPGDRGDRAVVVIEPGRAFGTGHHPSTVGCLERLEAVAGAPPDSAIDLGTGSGILAIAAARLGVGHVLAVDDDPDAVACARANVELNGVGDRVRCLLADAAAVEATAPLVLANLLAAAHARLAPAYRRLAGPGGRLVLGGILDGEADGVRAALGEQGFVETARLAREGWTTLELRAPAAPDAPVHRPA